MIRLEVQDYCHECREFTPIIYKPQNGKVTDEDGGPNTDRYVICSHGKRCAAIERYLRRQTEGDKG